MIEVKQSNDTDCYSACVASLLERDLSEIPYIFDYEEKTWFEDFCRDLKNKFGVSAISFTPQAVPHGVYTMYKDYWIATIHTEFTPEDGHAVIMKENVVVFDPTIDYDYKIPAGTRISDLEVTMCTIIFRCV